MIVIVILLTLTVILYSILFGNFGFLSGTSRKKEEKIVHSFLENVPCGGDWQPNEILKGKDERSEQDIYGQVFDSARAGRAIAKGKKNGLEVVNLFSDDLFLKSSEKTIVAVAEAFSNRRIDLLRNLLTENLFRNMANRINSLEDRLAYKTVVVSFDRKTIERRSLTRELKDNMLIRLSVLMNQINYIEDENHNVVYGSKNVIEKISEVWTFVFSGLENGQARWLVKSVDRYQL
ncbi:MAG: TIM44-like domain-containing protein [Rickettsiales bacterium]|jgi:predicted lipid-binding transport protein (Tim44 family)|nr:TIM44-like domain-containing protein [Rickettsiales bacterium]